MQLKPVINTVDAIDSKETEDFDYNKLFLYLNEHLLVESDWSKSKIYKCSSGYSNPPYIICCGANKYILRRKRDEWGILENHPNVMIDIKRQYKLISVLDKMTDIPVPKMCLFCDDETVIGKTFYIMQFIEGRIFTYNGYELPTLPKKDRVKVYKEMVRVLSLIHSIDINKTGIYDIIGDRTPYTVNGKYNEWKSEFNKVYKSKNVSKNIKKLGDIIDDKYIEYNKNNNYTDLDFTTLIHGDFHTENIIWDPIKYKIIAVIDWEACTLGNPMFELLYCCRIYRNFPTQDMLNLDPPIIEYHTGFRYIDVKQLGIPTETECIINYLYYANKVLSPIKMNKIMIWLKKENNWSFCFALLLSLLLGMFAKIFNDDEDNRINATFRDRQYVLLDGAAVNALLALKEPLKLKLSSKL